MSATHDWPAAVAELAAAVEGVVALPGEAGYEAAEDLFNTAVRQRPAMVVSARSAADVQAAVRFAAAHSLPVAVQATGHGIVVPADDAVLVSTRALRGIQVDAAARTVRIEAGVRSGEVVREVATAGLAVINGASPTVGTIGYTLGGGLGPLGRPYGYAVDHVRELEIVTADGELVVADAERHPDLYWASRGGKGNFGIVTALVTDLVPVSRLYGGGIYFPGEAAAGLLTAYREWAATVPDELTSSVALLRLPPIEVIPEPIRGKFVVHLRISYTGSAEDGERLVRPMRDVVPALLDGVGEMPYADVASIHNDPPDPAPFLDRAGLLRTLDPETIDVLLDVAGPAADPPLAVVELRHLGGALARPAARPSAVGHRDAAFSVFVGGVAAPDIADAVRDCEAGLMTALAPWLAGPFVSFLSGSDTDPAGIEAAYEPADYRRLREIKAVYDPENLFRLNHNIPPV
jgi:FAD/FMN-containing dehydrogenase